MAKQIPNPSERLPKIDPRGFLASVAAFSTIARLKSTPLSPPIPAPVLSEAAPSTVAVSAYVAAAIFPVQEMNDERYPPFLLSVDNGVMVQIELLTSPLSRRSTCKASAAKISPIH